MNSALRERSELVADFMLDTRRDGNQASLNSIAPKEDLRWDYRDPKPRREITTLIEVVIDCRRHVFRQTECINEHHGLMSNPE